MTPKQLEELKTEVEKAKGYSVSRKLKTGAAILSALAITASGVLPAATVAAAAGGKKTVKTLVQKDFDDEGSIEHGSGGALDQLNISEDNMIQEVTNIIEDFVAGDFVPLIFLNESSAVTQDGTPVSDGIVGYSRETVNRGGIQPGFNQLGKDTQKDEEGDLIFGDGYYINANNVRSEGIVGVLSENVWLEIINVNGARHWAVVSTGDFEGDVSFYYQAGQDNNNTYKKMTLNIKQNGIYIFAAGTTKDGMQGLYFNDNAVTPSQGLHSNDNAVTPSDKELEVAYHRYLAYVEIYNFIVNNEIDNPHKKGDGYKSLSYDIAEWVATVIQQEMEKFGKESLDITGSGVEATLANGGGIDHHVALTKAYGKHAVPFDPSESFAHHGLHVLDDEGEAKELFDEWAEKLEVGLQAIYDGYGTTYQYDEVYHTVLGQILNLNSDFYTGYVDFIQAQQVVTS